jgi:hypothetical protein
MALWGPARAADMLTLQLGESRSRISLGGRRDVGEYALHVQCPWRLVEGSRLVVGSGDLLTPAEPGTDREMWNWDVVGATWWDHRMQEFFGGASISITVQDTPADSFGGFRLICSRDVTFEVFSSTSAAPHEVSELWRLLQPSSSAKHFVVRTTGPEA